MNKDSLPLNPLEAIQVGHVLDKILHALILANHSLGPVQLLELDISNGFYRVNLNINDVPKLGVAFPTKPDKSQLMTFALVLPTGWKTPPLYFQQQPRP